MMPDRWQQISQLYHAALARDGDDRAAFLAEACHEDEPLRRELESLLAQPASAQAFLDAPALACAAQIVSDVGASALVGRRLGAYQVQAHLGAGGMGEVYRARDTKLGRDVAIKILPHVFTSDPERLARFEREARMLAALNHPNIGAIYGLEDVDGIRALVLELVDGETLADRIARGPLPLKDALPMARQIAEALDAAHDKGIVHRDLKPRNVALTRDGTVKVLDFGLAKATVRDGAAGDGSHAPTMTIGGTREGMVLGTAAYMSPEQARGQAVDKRTDIWAFGCVLYEMLTGRAVFPGETISDTIAAILEREPEWGALPAHTPAGIRQLLRRCLDKDPKRRLHDIADARIEIDDARSAPHVEGRVTPAAAGSRQRIVWLAALGFVALIAAVWAVWASRLALPAAEMRVEITTPPTKDLVSLAISPDGQKIVFVATSEARSRLWLRSLNAVSAQPLVGTDGASLPFWSPDSRSVGFFADGKLKRIDIDGGSARVLANAIFGRGGAWNRDGTIIFAPNPASPIFQVLATGGEPAAVTRVEAPPQVGHGLPQFLPDGRHFLYYVQGTPDASGVYVGELGGSETKRLLDADAAAVYAPPGQLLFVRRGTLFAQGFDPVRLALTGNPFPVAEQVAVDILNLAALSASSTGPIVYRTGSAGGQRQLAWFDRSGKELGKVGDPDGNLAFGSTSLSPDGRRVAISRSGGNFDIWLLEMGRGVLNRFTTDAADEIAPIWSPDGTHIVFSSSRKGRGMNLYRKAATGVGSEELILDAGWPMFATDWSPDGRFLLYFSSDPNTGFDIWTLPMDGDRKPFPIVRTKSGEANAQFSPNGKWIAYESNESGRYEIYVQAFSGAGPQAGGKVLISTNGGVQARWGRDGNTLFYIALDDRLITVPIRFASNGQGVEPSTPVPLFATRVGSQAFSGTGYSISPDGQRFLMNVELEGPAASPITVLLNWAGRNK